MRGSLERGGDAMIIPGDSSGLCEEGRAAADKYKEAIRAAAGEFFVHVKNCVHCKQYLLDTREEGALRMLLIDNQTFIKALDEVADDLGRDL
jgi:hypothetical protein